LRKYDHAKFKPTLDGKFWCNHCKRWLERDDFHKRPVPCGLNAWCKDCVSATKKVRLIRKKAMACP